MEEFDQLEPLGSIRSKHVRDITLAIESNLLDFIDFVLTLPSHKSHKMGFTSRQEIFV